MSESASGEVVPRPDPTRLTTEQLDRGLAGLDKLINVRMDALREAVVANTRTTDQHFTIIQTTTHGLKRQIDEIQERLTRLESTGIGVDAARTRSQASGQYIIAIIGIIVGTLIAVFGLLSKFFQ